MANVDIYSTETLEPPYNVDKLYELIETGLAQGGFTIPPVIMTTISPGDAAIYVLVPEGTYTQNQIDSIVSILNAVCIDPTRNDLTEDQQELADLQNKLNKAIANITAINGVPGGLKDQVNAATTGLKDRLLTNAAWNATPSTAAGAHTKADLLRQVQRDTLTLVVDALNILLDGARADKFELKHIQDTLEE